MTPDFHNQILFDLITRHFPAATHYPVMVGVTVLVGVAALSLGVLPLARHYGVQALHRWLENNTPCGARS